MGIDPFSHDTFRYLATKFGQQRVGDNELSSNPTSIFQDVKVLERFFIFILLRVILFFSFCVVFCVSCVPYTTRKPLVLRKQLCTPRFTRPVTTPGLGFSNRHSSSRFLSVSCKAQYQYGSKLLGFHGTTIYPFRVDHDGTPSYLILAENKEP